MNDERRIEQIAKDISRYIRDPQTGCWVWQRATFRSGHGAVKVGGKLRLAHRVIYTYFRGPIPVGLHLHHVCENPACVNPAHLLAVTPGEHSRLHGKLSYEKVDAIRMLAAEQGWKQARLAEMFEVDQSTISRVILGLSWPEQAARRASAIAA